MHGAVASAQTRVRQLAADRRCFHWPLEFPEVFLDSAGRPAPDGGFDAVIGNPPWEMLRADHGRAAANTLVRFSREAGIYHAQSRGHANQYQLFVERALSLLRRGGRLGLLVPGRLSHRSRRPPTSEPSCIRRHGLESLLVFDNRRAIFPIHRGVRFAAMTAVAQRPLSHVVCRFGIDTIDRLEHVSPESTDDFPIALTPAIIERLSGAQMAIPDLPDRRDLRLVEGLSAAHPALADPRRMEGDVREGAERDRRQGLLGIGRTHCLRQADGGLPKPSAKAEVRPCSRHSSRRASGHRGQAPGSVRRASGSRYETRRYRRCP